MKIDTSMQGRPFYLRTTDEDGAATFSEHTVWNPDLFIRARMDDAAKLNDDKGSTKATAVQLTREQFLTRGAA
jgi:hypothetical protein